MSFLLSPQQSPRICIANQHKYTFPKQQRFKKAQSNCLQAFYEINRSLDSRGYKVGNGPRSDFTKTKSQAPSPSQYVIPSAFDPQKLKTRGQTFGIARDVYTVVNQNSKQFGYLTTGLALNPGVGQYNSTISQPGMSYSMRPKTTSHWLPNFLQQQRNSSETPGPADYESFDSDQMGRTQNSRFRSVPGSVIGRSRRFSKKRVQQPGPTSYYRPDGLNDSGSYFESKYKGQGKRIISRQERRSFIDEIVHSLNQEQNSRQIPRRTIVQSLYTSREAGEF